MYSQVQTAIIRGIESLPVTVEADVSEGLPVFEMVGFISAEVKESRERVRASLKNLGLSLPVKRITVNFTPANIRKSGSGFDLPIAVAVLTAMGVISQECLEKVCIIGELGLNGGIHAVNGVLPVVITAKENNMRVCIVPKENEREAKLIPGITVVAVSSLKEVIEFIREGLLPDKGIQSKSAYNPENNEENIGMLDLNMFASSDNIGDFKEIKGQDNLRRACEIAASGKA